MRRNKVYDVLVYDAHLYGELDKCMNILAPQGKYFYIKHDKDGISPHYHIYFTFNELVRLSTVEILFQHYVCSKSFIKVATMGKYPMIQYMLQNGKYDESDIKSNYDFQ